MNCPHCNQEIPDKDITKHFAAIGGKKSKRTITPEQQRMMQESRRANRKEDQDERHP